MARKKLRLILWLAGLIVLPAPLWGATPKVLWVHKTAEHFVAGPAVGEKFLYASALGPFNTAALYALDLDPAAKNRIAWSKGPPGLKMPTVSTPALLDGRLFFGDGMHQTDGATLHCVSADSGGRVWQLYVPGQLVHLEGRPAIAAGRGYIGGGNAGVLCIDINRVKVDGKERKLSDVAEENAKRWKELMAKFEEEKKKDPDFAIPPNEDALAQAEPAIVWKKGAGEWHVDAAVTVVGEKVLAASAYLDAEKTGKRSLFCLNAGDGKTLWEAPLRFNPWAGPVVTGKTVLIGGSSIRFDPATLAGAKGEAAAVDLDSGTIRWRKELPGGVVSAPALVGDVAIFTITDGSVRAFEVADGKERWMYAAGAALFAGAAVGGQTVYAADLKGVVHAIGLKDGRKEWTLDLRTAPEVKTGGMVYGTPVVSGGRLYVATCSLVEDGTERRPNAVVCVDVGGPSP